jgi:pyruvate/2-oxoglutarate dehydrogenase complex dihydrolipoamide dehydrogenase (E3) component
MYTQALAQVGRVIQQVRDSPLMGVHVSTVDAPAQQPVLSVQIAEAMQWAKEVIDTCSEQISPVILGSLGVDVIRGAGEFCRLPHLGFIVNNRRLRARAYLIATGSRPEVPDIDGVKAINYRTPADIFQKGLQVGRLQVESSPELEVGHSTLEDANQPSNLPPFNSQPSTHQLQGSWVIIGGSPISIELAQTLVRLNCEVTLVVDTSQILPKEDLEASLLVQAQLEAEGIRVFTESPVTQVRRIDGKIWVQAGDQAIEADEIVLATGYQPNVEGLNLEGVGVNYNRQGLVLNEKLQTTNPRIYACGDVAGGYQLAHIAQYEASVALKNALFFPVHKVDYRGIPWAIFCEPQVARVGLTEAQARRRYGKDVFVVRQSFKTLDKAQWLGETTGFCKMIGRQNGEILGALIVGSEATELIGAIALAIRQKMKMKALADLPLVSPTLSEIIHKTALEWQQQRHSRHKMLQNFWEGFFNLRRNWSS